MTVVLLKMRCSIQTAQLSLNDMLGISCNLVMAAWSLTQANFLCCLCALNNQENGIDMPRILLEEECYTLKQTSPLVSFGDMVISLSKFRPGMYFSMEESILERSLRTF